MGKYGHLRPGSYNIISLRYADRQDIFEGASRIACEGNEIYNFELTPSERSSLEKLLEEANLPYNPDYILRYAKKAIFGRELAKFIFSRNLSDVLELIAYWAQSLGLSREDAAHIPVQSILDLNYRIGTRDTKTCFSELVSANKEEYKNWRPIKLSYLIRSERDIFIVPQHRAAPNFFGLGSARAPAVLLQSDSSCDIVLTGKIVLIENADPGFDWIFTRKPAGLVTKFGGANSHMTIRCSEYGLPAAIGVGEHLFERLSSAKIGEILLDPANASLQESGHL